MAFLNLSNAEMLLKNVCFGHKWLLWIHNTTLKSRANVFNFLLVPSLTPDW